VLKRINTIELKNYIYLFLKFECQIVSNFRRTNFKFTSKFND